VGDVDAMIRVLLTVFSLATVIFFPWPFAAAIALMASSIEPLIPLAAGIFADTLYLAPHTSVVPYFSVWGALTTVIVLLVRRWLEASIIRG
jgi:cation transporter-like permease